MLWEREFTGELGAKLLAHALLIDVYEHSALEILIVPQIALDRLTQKMSSRDALLARSEVEMFEQL
jgi:hypothetical protein